MKLEWTQDSELPHTHVVADEVETYYTTAPAEATLQEVADAFLDGYSVQNDDDGSPVDFAVTLCMTGECAAFSGCPNKSARRVQRGY